MLFIWNLICVGKEEKVWLNAATRILFQRSFSRVRQIGWPWLFGIAIRPLVWIGGMMAGRIDLLLPLVNDIRRRAPAFIGSR